MSTRLDCWNEIGVTGDRSCTELAEHTHCRNCPSYGATAATRLDRPSEDESIDAATTYYAAPRELENVAPSSCFVFRIGNEWLAIPSSLLDEVIGAKPAHSLPHRRGTVKIGIVSIRGDIVVHVSLAGLLGIADDEASPPNPEPHRHHARRVMVLANAHGRVATSVDEIMGMHRYDPAAARSVPSTLAQAMVSFATGMINVGDRIVGVLDGERLLSAFSQALA